MSAFRHRGQNPPAHGGVYQTFKIFCKADEGNCLSVRNGNVVLAPANPRDEHQHWYKDMRFTTQIKDEEGNPAFALVNKVTGLAMCHPFYCKADDGSSVTVRNGASFPVKLVPYNENYNDKSVLWTESGFPCIHVVNNIYLDRGGVREGSAQLRSLLRSKTGRKEKVE